MSKVCNKVGFLQPHLRLPSRLALEYISEVDAGHSEVFRGGTEIGGDELTHFISRKQQHANYDASTQGLA